ncbi:MAG: cytochrome c [Dehalococcoidia bacterium]|nr:cytochrome c [Dehalococcoidia bacterium]
MSTPALRVGRRNIVGTAGLAFFSFTMLISLACSSPPEPNTPVPTERPIVTEPVARSGQEIFASICSACHGLQGQGQPNWHIPKEDGTLPAPPLNGDGHTWHHGDGFLYRVVREGGKFQEDPVLLPNFKSAMPAFGAQLSHEETVEVIEYVKNWWGGKTSRGLSIVEAQAIKSSNDPFPDG